MSILNIKEQKELILEKLKSNEVIDFIKKYDISSVLIFGSFNNKSFTQESDIDIAIIGKHKIDLEDILEIELFLTKLLNKDIDVIDLKGENLNLFLKINALNEGEVIYCNDNNCNLEEFREEIDKIYKENENFFWFRRKDVLS